MDQAQVMDHIFFVLQPNEYVAYFGDGVPNRVFLAYNAFLGFLRKSFPVIVNYDGLKKEIDSFQVVMLQQSGMWEVVQPEYMENPSQAKFVDLVSINAKKDEVDMPMNEKIRNASYTLYDVMKKKKENAYRNSGFRAGRKRI